MSFCLSLIACMIPRESSYASGRASGLLFAVALLAVVFADSVSVLRLQEMQLWGGAIGKIQQTNGGRYGECRASGGNE